MNTVHLETPRELAERIGWPVRRIRQLVARHQIRHYRIGRSIMIPVTAIDELLQQTEVEPKSDEDTNGNQQ